MFIVDCDRHIFQSYILEDFYIYVNCEKKVFQDGMLPIPGFARKVHNSKQRWWCMMKYYVKN